MTVIPTLHFCGQCEEAIGLYKEAFNCKVQYLMHYSDVVERGWEEDIPEKRNTVYHSEILFGEQLFRMSDGADTEPNINTAIFFAVNFDTVEEVKKAYEVLQASGTVVEKLKTTPFSIMAAEKDCLLPGAKVIDKVKKVWKKSDTYLLKNRGHINNLTREEKEIIKTFLL